MPRGTEVEAPEALYGAFEGSLGGVYDEAVAGYTDDTNPAWAQAAFFGLAMMIAPAEVVESGGESQGRLVDTIIHEELHHRWWARRNYGDHHTDRSYDVINRFLQMKGL